MPFSASNLSALWTFNCTTFASTNSQPSLAPANFKILIELRWSVLELSAFELSYFRLSLKLVKAVTKMRLSLGIVSGMRARAGERERERERERLRDKLMMSYVTLCLWANGFSRAVRGKQWVIKAALIQLPLVGMMLGSVYRRYRRLKDHQVRLLFHYVIHSWFQILEGACINLTWLVPTLEHGSLL